jgi:LysM repeat protein
MSRRDTIIIAVLLNAGLLIVLFATSLKSDSEAPEASALASAPKVEEVQNVQPLAVASTVQTPAGDEVDQMMKQFTPPAIGDNKTNFAADLQAIGSQESAPLAPIASAPAPEPVAAPVAAPASSFKEVKVKKGDVLERIARNNHVSVDEIMKANNLSSTRLKIGQVLKVPSGSKSSAKAENSFAAAKPADDVSSKYYTIKVGDNPWTIAVKNHMKVEELLKLNNLDEEKARRLKPGDKIRIK